MWGAVATTLAACSGSPASPPGGTPAERARVGLVEWEVTTAAGALVKGPVVLVVTNAGTTEHDLRIRGRRTDATTPRLPSGGTAQLKVDLSGEREVELFCTVPGHRAQGMVRRLPVRRPPG